jgi:hypothetical protein
MEQRSRSIKAEHDLVEVSNILMWTRLRRFIKATKRKATLTRSISDPQKSPLKKRGPFVITELFSESALKYMNAAFTQLPASKKSTGEREKESCWDKLMKVFQTHESKESDVWTSPLFAAGKTYLHDLPDLILSHAYLNSGFISFINTLISKCGESFTLAYESIEQDFVSQHLFRRSFAYYVSGMAPR